MRLRFLKVVAVGRGQYLAGTEAEVEDQHAAELYVAQGEAEVVGEVPPGFGDTLKRRFPAHSAAHSPQSMVRPGVVTAVPGAEGRGEGSKSQVPGPKSQKTANS